MCKSTTVVACTLHLLTVLSSKHHEKAAINIHTSDRGWVVFQCDAASCQASQRLLASLLPHHVDYKQPAGSEPSFTVLFWGEDLFSWVGEHERGRLPHCQSLRSCTSPVKACLLEDNRHASSLNGECQTT